MSDEAFLARWSRRKRAVGEAAPEAVPAARESGDDRPSNQVPEPPVRDAAGPSEAPATAEVDLSALPPVESITAETDIRAFLASGVPAQLTRAALRRAWAADPAIRDFVGLAENAWDFTAPDGVPGFGPLLPGDEASQLVVDASAEGEVEVEDDSSDADGPGHREAHLLKDIRNTTRSVRVTPPR